MSLFSLNHLAIITSNLKQTQNFYGHKLGFKLQAKHFRPPKKDWLLKYRQGNLTLEIFVKPKAPKRPTYPEALGLRHLAFDAPDIESMILNLKKRGINCEKIRRDPFTKKKMTFFHDPDGLPIELYQTKA